ncbi:MAG: PfkB family carbohydrate kinase [Hyphomicrobiaceae bacterium]
MIVTLGSQGLVHRCGTTLPQTISAHPVRTLSSHGAGDAFMGALCSELVRPSKPDRFDDAPRYASAAAAPHVSTPLEEPAGIRREQVLSILAD